MGKRKERVVLLCEDQQQELFARRFLLKRGFAQYQITTVDLPRGRAAAEAYVRRQFPTELKAFRRRASHQRVLLAVMVDADVNTVEQRKAALDAECTGQGVSPRGSHEKVAVFVPKRNIETWIYWIAGKQVDERTAYPKLPRPGDCVRDVKRFAEESRQGLPENAPSSLHDACDELARIL